MRGLAIALLVACSGTTSSSHGPPTPAAPSAAQPCPSAPSVAADPHAARRAEIAADLEKIDRELDALEADFIAAGQHMGFGLREARDRARASKTALEATRFDTPVDERTPVLLARAQRDLTAATIAKQKLATELGARHPRMELAELSVAFHRDVVEQQLDSERRFAASWFDVVDRLPHFKTSADVYLARVEVLRSVLADQHVPSEAPARVRIARENLVALTWKHDELATSVGPKHPDLVAAAQQVADAKEALKAAITAADGELAARRNVKPPSIDLAAVTRRGELAERARELRREYEALAK